MLVELEAIERNLVGKSEQDLVMFGAMRDEEGGVKKTPCFLAWTMRRMFG